MDKDFGISVSRQTSERKFKGSKESKERAKKSRVCLASMGTYVLWSPNGRWDPYEPRILGRGTCLLDSPRLGVPSLVGSAYAVGSGETRDCRLADAAAGRYN